MGQGLSIANNLLANNVQLNLNNNQSALKNIVTQLSSGLRINTAADDPSGLAIATNLQTQVDGFNQAVQNVQNANNAAQVAEGALQTTTDILQRIRSLAVEAASDINSNSDRQNLQSEVSQLLLEVNRISQNTNFNGQALLDGSHAGFQAQQTSFYNVTANAALATNGGFSSNIGTLNLASTTGNAAFGTVTLNNINTGFLAAQVVVADSNQSVGFQTTAIQQQGYASVAGGAYQSGGVEADGATASPTGAYSTVDGTIELQVINTGVSIAVQETFVNSATGAISVSSTLYGGANAAAVYGAGLPAGLQTVAADFDNVAIAIGSISSADVGTTAYVKVSQNVAALTNPNNPAFNFQSGADEGDVIQVGIQATNTQTLRVSNINVALSASNNPSLGAEDAIGQIDNALERLLNQRAQLGSVIVRLNEDASNDNIAAVNMQASESSIRDLNVGQATTEFTKLQILVQVGTSVLAQSNSNAQTVLGLLR